MTFLERSLLDRDDRIEVVGHATAGGSTRAEVVLPEPGGYDVLPLYRRWGYDQSPGFPHPIRIEVGGPPRPVPMALAALGIVGAVAAIGWRRRATRVTQ